MQHLANFTCVRLESDVLFGQKNQWKPILRATASGFSNFHRHWWLRPAGRRIPPPARKTSGTQGKRNKLYLLNRLSHGRQAAIRGVTWLSIVLFTAFICIVKSYGSIFFWLKTGTSYSLSNRDKLKKKDNTTLTEAGERMQPLLMKMSEPMI